MADELVHFRLFAGEKKVGKGQGLAAAPGRLGGISWTHHDALLHLLLAVAHVGHAELAELVVQKAALILPQLASAVDNACKGSGVVLRLGLQRMRWDRIAWDRLQSNGMRALIFIFNFLCRHFYI